MRNEHVYNLIHSGVLLVAGLFTAALLVAGVTLSVSAQQNRESITLSPAQRIVKVDAGAQHKDELTVVNDGTVAYDFVVYARPYSVKGSGYEQDFQTTPPNADVYSW